MDITATQLKQLLDTGERVQLIDVREAYEWEASNLSALGATWIPLSDVLARMNEIERDADVVIYCRSGGRSAGVVRLLRARGFNRVLNLHGGLLAWADEVDPAMDVY